MTIENSSHSPFFEKWKKFRSVKRGYYSLKILLFCYLLSFLNPLWINNKALIVKFEGKYYFPAFWDLLPSFVPAPYYSGEKFGQTELFGFPHHGIPNYRELKKSFSAQNTGNWVFLTLYPYGPVENLLSEIKSSPPLHPEINHWMGIDNQGRDVFSRLVYGFRISLSFALLVTVLSYAFGIFIGGLLGYLGGRVDLYGLRIIEIISGIPFLFFTMILVNILKPSFFLLVSVLVFLGGWIGISYYIRGEFLREKAKDYVLSALATGASDLKVMFHHILPNALVPVITFAPFSIVGYISVLVSLDFLGLGLAPPTPSWGELLNQGVSDIRFWWLIVFPLGAIFMTLMMIVFIGEAIREAFDPKAFVRLR